MSTTMVAQSIKRKALCGKKIQTTKKNNQYCNLDLSSVYTHSHFHLDSIKTKPKLSSE